MGGVGETGFGKQSLAWWRWGDGLLQQKSQDVGTSPRVALGRWALASNPHVLVPVQGWRWGDRLRQAIPGMVALGRRAPASNPNFSFLLAGGMVDSQDVWGGWGWMAGLVRGGGGRRQDPEIWRPGPKKVKYKSYFRSCSIQDPNSISNSKPKLILPQSGSIPRHPPPR